MRSLQIWPKQTNAIWDRCQIMKNSANRSLNSRNNTASSLKNTRRCKTNWRARNKRLRSRKLLSKNLKAKTNLKWAQRTCRDPEAMKSVRARSSSRSKWKSSNRRSIKIKWWPMVKMSAEDKSVFTKFKNCFSIPKVHPKTLASQWSSIIRNRRARSTGCRWFTRSKLLWRMRTSSMP